MTDAIDGIESLLAGLDDPERPGGVVGIALDEQVVLHRAFGMANLERHRANEASTRFPIGSVTKHITSAAVLALAADGRWRLEDPIGRWLPELRGPTGAATLRQLMEHTGGEHCYLDLGFCDGFGIRPVGSALAIQARQTTRNFAAGTEQCYSNGGYTLLSLAIERAVGQSFAEALRTRFFEPLSMVDTTVARIDTGARDSATPYLRLPDAGWTAGIDVLGEPLGDGGIVSSVVDLLRWIGTLRRGRRWAGVVGLDALANPTRLAGGASSPYGFGLVRERYRGLEIVGHGGNVMGANSHLLTVPAHALDVVVLTNDSGIPAKALALEVVARLCAASADAPRARPRAADHPTLHGHRYASASGLLYAFGESNGVLALGLQGGAPVPLDGDDRDPHDATRLPFTTATATAPLRFRDDHGLVVEAPGRVDRPTPLDPRASPATLEGLGDGSRFASVDAAAEITIAIDGDSIRLHGRGDYGSNDFDADTMNDDLLVLRHRLMPWTAVARLVRETDRPGDRVVALEVTTTRTRALRFSRVG